MPADDEQGNQRIETCAAAEEMQESHHAKTCVAAEELQENHQAGTKCCGSTTGAGHVTLVGAGCGPDLITLKGLEAVRRAQVLLYDDLIDPALVDEANSACEKIYVGKRYGKHSMKQEEINALLVEAASTGREVVRLKGGDSFVFGRGGEEVLALQEAGIHFEMIPGVSSCIAVPECAGIPVTHRKLARSFTVVTGKSADGTGEDYEALASLKGTLVFLMGLHAYPQITAQLIAHGMDPGRSAAVISNGCSENEERIDGTLANIAELAANAPTPAILVVGETAGFHMKDVMEKQAKSCVIVTGTQHFVEKTVKVLRENGLDASGEVTIELETHPEQIPENLDDYDWLAFTSANGISLFFETLRARGKDIRTLAGKKIACIGSGTQDKLWEYGVQADLVPASFTAGQLGKELAQRCTDSEQVLILRAQQGSPLLTQVLDEAQIQYEDRKIYRTVAAAMPGQAEHPDEPEKPKQPCYIVFGSASGVHAWLDSRDWQEGDIPVCIGKYTAQALPDKLQNISIISDTYTAQGVAHVICEKEEQEKKNQGRRNQETPNQVSSRQYADKNIFENTDTKTSAEYTVGMEQAEPESFSGAVFPLFVKLEGKSVLVIGAGKIALRRIQVLLTFGANITVISPRACEEIQLLAKEGKFTLQERAFRQEDIHAGLSLVLSATDNHDVDALVVSTCRQNNIPVNAASDHTQCDFYFPSVVRKGHTVIGISSDGKHHSEVKELRKKLETALE